MFDVIVVGGGPAGLSGALMLGRCRRSVLVCDLGQPRNRRTQAVHGYLTRDGIAPTDFLEAARRELTRYGVQCRPIGVTSAEWTNDRFVVALADQATEHARYLLIATGVVDDLPLIPGVDDCYGQSIFHCPYCDGWEWRDRRLAALGRGRAAAQLGLGLTAWSKDVVVCSNGTRIPARERERLEANGIGVRTGAISRVDHRDGALTGIVFANGESMPRDALFFSTGQHPQSDLAMRLGCELTARGTIKTDTLSATNVSRVYVAGDASRDAQFVVVAAAEGVKAAVAINKALLHEELTS